MTRYSSLVIELENAINSYNPAFINKFDPGLSLKKIEGLLARWKVEGDVEPIVALYSWRNGMPMESFPLSLDGSRFEVCQPRFFPQDPFYWQGLRAMCADFHGLGEAAVSFPNMQQYVGRYFPIFWGGRAGWFAVDLDVSGNNRIIYLHWDDVNPEPFELYPTFEVLLVDLIDSFQENRSLQCFPIGREIPVNELDMIFNAKARSITAERENEKKTQL